MQNEKLQKLIQENSTQEAIDWLSTQSLSNAQSRALAIIAAEFNTLTQAERKGTLPYETIQLRTNQINDRLLSLIDTKPAKTTSNTVQLFKIIIPVFLVLGGLFFGYRMLNSSYDCPEYPDDIRNRIIILPFEKIAGQPAKPQIVLRDRINQLTAKNELSTKAKLGKSHDNLDPETLANACAANAVIWGTYSAKEDSLRLILQYAFLEKPKWNNMGELIVMKDVTALQNGKMLKDLDDSILSLCALIAVRQGNIPVAKKWLDKVKHPENLDRELSDLLAH